MPPWHADPAIGRFANERRLTEAEKDTLLRWTNGGAPEGDRAKLPPAPTFAAGWQFGTPDVVIEMPESFAVPAEGEVPYQYFVAPTNFAEDTWSEGIEVRAGARSVVHHVLVYVRDPSGQPPKPAFKGIPVDDRYKAWMERQRERAKERASRGETSEPQSADSRRADRDDGAWVKPHGVRTRDGLSNPEGIGVGIPGPLHGNRNSGGRPIDGRHDLS